MFTYCTDVEDLGRALKWKDFILEKAMNAIALAQISNYLGGRFEPCFPKSTD